MPDNPDFSRDAVIAMQQRFNGAIAAGDITKLGGLLDADFRMAHGNGRLDDAASLLELAGTGRYVGWETDNSVIRLVDNVAIIAGDAKVTVQEAAGPRPIPLRFVCVWARQQSAIRALLWQSSLILG